MSLLANRYASAQMCEIWSPESKIISERKLWIAVMRAQTKLGHSIPDSVIADYEKVVNFLETLYSSNRLLLPLKAVLVVGY